MNYATLEARIIIFIVEQTNANLKKISLETRLAEDLGIDGDDALEFFENFSQEFQVDLLNFEFDKHFGYEAGFNPLTTFLNRSKHKLETITTKDLVTAAIANKWQKKSF